MENLTLSFHKFLKMAKTAYINGDDELAHKAAEDITAKTITFGFNEDNDYRADNIKGGKFGFSFDVIKRAKKSLIFKCISPADTMF